MKIQRYYTIGHNLFLIHISKSMTHKEFLIQR